MQTSNPRLHVRKKQIRLAVTALLAQLKEAGDVSLPVPVDKIAKALNARVLYVNTDDDDLSGFIYRDLHSGQTVIGINATHSRTRQRFTLAHELGHLVLHSFEDLHYDRKGYGSGYGQVRRRDSISATGENRDEVEANFFAAELLMPEELLLDKLEEGEIHDILEKSVDAAIKALAGNKVFDVSPQALTIRMVQLGIINTL